MNQSENSMAKILEVASRLYKTTQEEIKKLSGGYQNEVYEYKVGEDGLILRITKNIHREIDALKSELDFIEGFHQAGILVSTPIHSINKKKIEEITIGDEKFYITSFTKAEGHLINVSDPNEWNNKFFQKWGQTMGKMHSLVKNNNQTYKRNHFGTNISQINETTRFLSSISDRMAKGYESLITKLNLLKKDHDTYGLIHNDFHQGNFFVKEGQMTIFDFDDCSFNWFAQDIAVSFYHAVWQGMSFNPDNQSFPHQFLESFFKGYREECELKKDTIVQIPLFLKLREVFLFTLFNEKWELEQLEEWQKYTLNDLRFRIENEIPYTDIDFVSFR
ncbi:phosphotransferase [Bacillus sp. RG28]|uniref:Phosphotransferase n=1 Tax=Gottfriedia endophytica TaxID=2820819 RepID=A0A940SIA1_9BACI|nr:phosphotransferase [Gottfriedia endophytica]MBP0724775.1 phosphotransferase [Gottfriedia endophytica]